MSTTDRHSATPKPKPASALLGALVWLAVGAYTIFYGTIWLGLFLIGAGIWWGVSALLRKKP